jgi:delta1-piperideine-2-carboxylate reductase
VARILAENCAGCERDGAHSHGVFRIAGYLSSLRSGWINLDARPVLEDAGAAFIRVDADNGFAQPALELAVPLLLEKTRTGGAAIVAIRDSHHFSALWPDLEPFARQGLVGLSCVTGFGCVVPHGGTKPVLGTNPICFATPVAGEHPFVFDQATSALSNGDVRIAAREGRVLPSISGIDRGGHPTADPNAILDGGALMTFGGHKGAAISMMVEILAAALTGGQFSSEVDFSKNPGAETPRTGLFLLLIDPGCRSNGGFSERVAELLGRVRDSGQMRLPGERRYRQRERSLAEGVPLDRAMLEYLRSLSS